jgi:hypothetical protein
MATLPRLGIVICFHILLFKVYGDKVPETYPRNKNNRVSESKVNLFSLPSARLLREAKSTRIKLKIEHRTTSSGLYATKICLTFIKNQRNSQL